MHKGISAIRQHMLHIATTTVIPLLTDLSNAIQLRSSALPCCLRVGELMLWVLLLQMNWPFWRISNHSDLAALHHALDLSYL